MPCRRQLPSLLFSAVAATAVIMPLASYGLPGEPVRMPVATDPLITERPLDGIGDGETVRELHQDTPFAMVALTADDLTGTSARVRAKQANGSWGPWYEAESLEGLGPDGAGVRGTEPVFVGHTTDVQIAVDRTPAAPARPTGAPKSALGYLPASVERPLGQDVRAVLISPPQAPVDISSIPPEAATPPGVPPAIIGRAQWGANESEVCGKPVYDSGVRAGVVHHTAGSNDYGPQDSAGIVRSIFEYHTRTLGWCDIAYNALVDKYGQVFEGRAGGIDRPVEGAHTGGFNLDTWGVAMLGNFDDVPPTPIQLRTTGRLLGWRLGIDHVDPLGNVVLTSAGGSFTKFPQGAAITLPTIFTHRDVGNTDCPGNAAYAAMPLLRDTAAHFNTPIGPRSLADTLRGGAIYAKWAAMGGEASPLGAPSTPETPGDGASRYVTFDKGAMYWSPVTGAEPLTGSIYEAWGKLGFERGALGLPTSGEIQEPQWIVQNFQHGTLNLDRLDGSVTRVIDGVALDIPLDKDHSPVQLERFTPIGNRS
ncbi:N-acetylmuramoyl-L-alanine amidase [Mycolicibacterium sp. 050158]|uniref:N-acetylmuramoyl-L-alanine amidase n=1 Tax=Mycolicibacterium sp. 050158 TaxID=3090602 RepID=UPI00299DB491|nr:N-acetylmuramoyl-L-alanine amidase [Mycolicibacterium sp. 050158]MDX1889565.1 N-acetylmuramoyl-L-alanine amidase [Mycolicibacterium sp. 050158]